MRGSGADPARLESHLRALEGERHPSSSPEALERALDYAEKGLAACGLEPERDPFPFQDDVHENVFARIPGAEPDAPRVLVGAHVDSVRGTPGADDNAS
ncbi:MAG TPA: M28 family peptidase, partial [Longimicrobiales bacterium]|nr:M28 family peptidase [Longimicrobiales bacterium]